MPQQIFNARNPTGAWVDDARDTTERWNTARADQLSQFEASKAQGQSQDDWRREIALKQLGLNRDIWMGGREDTASARADEANRWGQKFDLERRQFDYGIGRAQAADKREEEARQKAELKRAAYAKLAADPTAFADTKTLAGRLGQIDPETGMPMLVEKMLAEERRREAEKALAAQQVPELLRSTDPLQRKRGEALAAKAGLDLETYRPARVGVTAPQEVLSQDPALMNKIDEIAGQVARLSIYGGGSQEQAAAGNLARQQLWSLAIQKAHEYGADPTQLFRMMEAQIAAKIPWTTGMQDIGRSISTLGGILDDPRAKYANALLGAQ